MLDSSVRICDIRDLPPKFVQIGDNIVDANQVWYVEKLDMDICHTIHMIGSSHFVKVYIPIEEILSILQKATLILQKSEKCKFWRESEE